MHRACSYKGLIFIKNALFWGYTIIYSDYLMIVSTQNIKIDQNVYLCLGLGTFQCLFLSKSVKIYSSLVVNSLQSSFCSIFVQVLDRHGHLIGND
jgi:hypothetical protein